MRVLRQHILFNPAIWLSIGLALACLGGLLISDIPSNAADSAWLGELPDLSDAAVGEVAVVEGQVSADTPALPDGFVIVIREAYKSCGRSSCWSEIERHTPPFTISSDDALVHIINFDYAVESTDIERQDAKPSWASGSRRSRGFVAGSPIFAVGQVDRREGALTFEAEWVAVGTRAAYLEAQEQYRSRGMLWGGGITAVGLLLTAIGSWQAWRFWRTAHAND